MNKSINKIQNILLIIFTGFITISFVLITPMGCSDELWNFQNIHKMIRGLKIYNDANVIITPIFYYIGYIFVKIFGGKLLGFKIYNVVIYVIEFIFVDKILKKLNMLKVTRILTASSLIFFSYTLMISGANYNTLAIVFSLIGLYLYVLNKRSNFLQGIIIFLVFFTKQNIGVLYFIAGAIYELYRDGLSKKFIANQIKKGLVTILFSAILILQMFFSGNLYSFINYAFLGMFDFGKNNVTFTVDPFYGIFFIIIIVLYVFIRELKKKDFKLNNIDEFIENLTLLLIFSIVMSFIEYPIFNTAHLLTIFPFYLIFVLYFFDVLLIKELFEGEAVVNVVKWFAIMVLLVSVIRIILVMIFSFDGYTTINDFNSPFWMAKINTNVIEHSLELEKYITERNKENVDVMILSYEAAYTMINLNQSHGVYDLLFYGNLGYDGTNRIIEEIKSQKNCEYLIFIDEKDMFWQEPKEIREFIINNLEKKGEIGKYLIYTK